ncbi:hypothetical protein [Yoonia sp. SDW83-1]|uniref:hypothetical protein n=2 Tax=unclassified Yoonia TaxID=2629118 RepID=UPI00398C7F7C
MTTKEEGGSMNDRWQKSLEAAVAAYDTPMPWERGTQRQALITRRKLRIDEILRERAEERRQA